MKTSNKIFIGIAIALAVVCIVNMFITHAKEKKYDALALGVARQLESTAVRVVIIDRLPVEDAEKDRFIPPISKDSFTRKEEGNNQALYLSYENLENAHISADTLYLDRYNSMNHYFLLFSSSTLETVVIREEGRPDEVFDYRSADSDQGAEPDHDPGEQH